VSPLGGEGQAQGAPDPAGAAGYHRHPILEAFHEPLSPTTVGPLPTRTATFRRRDG
jgi:hypothetical protein